MKLTHIRTYRPFVALVGVQALLILALPSTAPERSQIAMGGVAPAFGGESSPPGTTTPATTPAPPSTDSGTSVSVDPSTVTAAPAPTDPPATEPPESIGDTSHCVGEYQFDVMLDRGPPCQPVFEGDNGGVTYNGVDEDSILIVFFSGTSSDQSDAAMEAKGLSTPAADRTEALNVYEEFINSHYELYGRTIDFVEVMGNCPDGPLDYQACEASINEVIKMDPFMVLWQTTNYPEVFDLLANEGIVSIGGSSFEESYYTARRPFRYDIFMDGTTVAAYLGDYYCTKLVGRPPDHAGTEIGPGIGNRAAVAQRRLGIVVPEVPANRDSAQRIVDAVNGCGGAGAASGPYTYSADISTSTQQTEATIAAMLSDGVTTVLCLCDPIFPVFLTMGMTMQGYFPEHLIGGTGFTDMDTIGQLYDPQQMTHAFGLSQMAAMGPLDDSDAARIWQAQGRDGHPCGNSLCGLEAVYMTTAARMIQQAGPELNPLTLEHAALTNMPAYGGEGRVPLSTFGEGDYTLWSDVKEVFWDPLGITPVDGSNGAFVTIAPECGEHPAAHECARRYTLGEWSDTLTGVPINP